MNTNAKPFLPKPIADLEQFQNNYSVTLPQMNHFQYQNNFYSQNQDDPLMHKTAQDEDQNPSMANPYFNVDGGQQYFEDENGYYLEDNDGAGGGC